MSGKILFSVLFILPKIHFSSLPPHYSLPLPPFPPLSPTGFTLSFVRLSESRKKPVIAHVRIQQHSGGFCLPSGFSFFSFSFSFIFVSFLL